MSGQYSPKIPDIGGSVGRRPARRARSPDARPSRGPSGRLIRQFGLVRREQGSLTAGTFSTRDPVRIIDQTRSAP